MFGFSKKKLRENDCCRYCKFAQKSGEEFICRYNGAVEESFVCKRYVFNPFAPRVPRVRSVDTTMFDPLDFRLD